ncbi:type II toxin-antitoxin system VapC family toxin [Tersicoccus sp. MR15.9]|uniref:type II toxin-antitoxin system VapC family toxin n=1 Tax=Tersicoccus mangrovi TaxID=3121635 RepID=UPI002FE513D7
MKIVDAGVVVELLAGRLDPRKLGDEELACPHLIDSEVTHVLRGLMSRGALSEEQGALALEGFIELTMTRFPTDWLRRRIWELRHNLGGYDATYVALAELTGASALLTTDTRLARAPGTRCRIDLV